MPIDYENLEPLHEDPFDTLDNWHHEGIGELHVLEAGERGLRLHCSGSKQGGEGCMAFFRPDLPDHIAVEYDVTIQSHGGLVINYLAIRGIHGEDMIRDETKLGEKRTGIMANYFSSRWGLQSYHVSFSRFDDKGRHTGTSNWRRNPGGLLVGHGVDPCCQIGQSYHIRLVKDRGSCQLYVDGQYAHGFMDRDTSLCPIPDTGKFGIRLIGSEVKADFRSFKVFRVQPNEGIWTPWRDS